MTLTPDQQIQRARESKRLLEDGLLAEAFERAEANFIQQWLGTAPKDVQIREAAYSKVQALAEVQRVLRSIISDGELQVARLNRKGDKVVDI